MTHYKDCPYNVSNWFFPHKCGICGKFNSDYLCVKCYNLLKSQENFTVDFYDFDKDFFSEHLYYFKYEGIIRKLILDYKFNDFSFLYKTFVKFFIKNKKLFNFLKSYDTIIPIPISKNRFKERGFNQSELLAREIIKQYKKNEYINYSNYINYSKVKENYKNKNKNKNRNKDKNKDKDIRINTNLELVNNNLIKVNNIIEQSKLNRKQRENNVKGAYKILNKEKLIGKSILLIDDVYTTGSTVRECCITLKKTKPKKIGVMTIAKD